ncbi:MAG TPA: DUF4037 domain-containing protein [Caulobacteraceae bacterium]|jgi:hypothetical protein|nr:DUF4037 domain-containing protein [Caulobacteraceae bacterium]
MSRDHNWGPRVGLFVTPADFETHAQAVVERFAGFAPEDFLGFPIGMSSRPGQGAQGDGDLGDGARADPRHGLEVRTIETMLRRELALGPDEPRDALTWLGLSEQQLLVVTAGAVFHDDDGALTRLRRRLSAFPRDVRLYKLACQWRRIAEEQAFVGRTGLGGDELGSRVIAARLVRDAMRMAFLIEDRYAPYPKWFGKAFAALPCAAELAPMLGRALAAADWRTREAALAEACLALAKLHRARGLPGRFEPAVGPFHDRPFTVINADAIGQAIHAEIADPALAALPVIGSLDQVTDSTPLTQAPARARRAMSALFDDGEAAAVEEA